MSKEGLFYTKQTSHLLVCPHEIYVVSRLSPGWEASGRSSTLFGSTSGVYMLESTYSRGPRPCLAKLRRTFMNHEKRSARGAMRRPIRRSPKSHPVFKCGIYIWGHVGKNIIYIHLHQVICSSVPSSFGLCIVFISHFVKCDDPNKDKLLSCWVTV